MAIKGWPYTSVDGDSGSGQPRIDIIVFESNENTEVRAPRFVAVKGTPAASWTA